MGMVVHVDEVHDYMDDGILKTSCEHAHVFVCAHAKWKDKKTNELREGINGKNFETKATLNKLNKAVDDMCLSEFGISYNTGGEVRKKSVEELKQKSYIETLKAVDIVNEQKEQAEIQLNGVLEEREFAEQELQAKQIIINNQQKQINALSEQLKTKDDEIRGKNMELERLQNVEIELLEKQQELEQAKITLTTLETRCKEIHEQANEKIKTANDEITLLTEQRETLQSQIDTIFAENEIKQRDIDELSDRFSTALNSAFAYGQKAGKESYEGEKLNSFKNDSISKCIKLLDEPLKRVKTYINGLKERMLQLFNHYNKEANNARKRSLGMIEVYTDKNGHVSEKGKEYIERYITMRLETNDKDADWEPHRAEYRRLPAHKKKKMVDNMVNHVIDAKETHEALAREGAWIKTDKIDMKIDKIMKSFAHIRNPLQAVVEMQQEYLDEMER